MKTCKNFHEIIAFYSEKCPLCEVISETNDEIESLKKQIEDLEDEIL